MEKVELRQLEVCLTFTFTYSGNLSPESLGMRLYNDTGVDRKIKYVRASVGISPQGNPIVLDILCNDKSIFTRREDDDVAKPIFTPRLMIVPNTNTSTLEPISPSWGKNEYLTVNIKEIGTTFAGADLTINVVVSE
ncbi:MAG: hypothetical protein E6R04_00080 [Spirochaetes bacterium]|nr:MAG: hypothetical protein E6R04_00080 [Spirochaetota bacterium]